MAGYLIDQSPGLTGFQHMFMGLLGTAVIGAVAALAFTRLPKTGAAPTRGQ